MLYTTFNSDYIYNNIPLFRHPMLVDRKVILNGGGVCVYSVYVLSGQCLPYSCHKFMNKKYERTTETYMNNTAYKWQSIGLRHCRSLSMSSQILVSPTIELVCASFCRSCLWHCAHILIFLNSIGAFGNAGELMLISEEAIINTICRRIGWARKGRQHITHFRRGPVDGS